MKNCNTSKLEQTKTLVTSQCLSAGKGVEKQDTLVTPQCFYAGYSVKKQRGFTLIELLVVVLIIGILAAIAVPQYQKAVEKSRLTEALSNMRTIEQNMDLFLLENGFPASGSGPVYLENMGGAGELQGGSWTDHRSRTKNFGYYGQCDDYACAYTISRGDSSGSVLYYISGWKFPNNETWNRECHTVFTDIGRTICNSLASQGFGVLDT